MSTAEPLPSLASLILLMADRTSPASVRMRSSARWTRRRPWASTSKVLFRPRRLGTYDAGTVKAEGD